MHVFCRFPWRIKLNACIQSRKIETSSSHVRREEHTALAIRELEECACSLWLRKVSVQSDHRAFQQSFFIFLRWSSRKLAYHLTCKFYTITAVEKHHYLVLGVHIPVEEREQRTEPQLAGNLHIELLEGIWNIELLSWTSVPGVPGATKVFHGPGECVLSGGNFLCGDPNQARFLQRVLRQGPNPSVQRGRAEARLPPPSTPDLFEKRIQNGSEGFLEAQIQQTICFVQDKKLQALHLPCRCVFKVIFESSRCSHHNVDSFPQSGLFFAPILPAHDHPSHDPVVIFEQQGEHLPYLQAQFSGGADHQSICSFVPVHTFFLADQCLHGGQQERQGLS
mmetsp:Transcript_10135/g.61682  ORF Transcript_10135/g.61682 Transcript_10135/m.61682 type:complete len:336 (+) Transcript_10135:2648-3655(+)